MLWLKYSACFLSFPIFDWWGRESHQLQGTPLSLLCDLMDGMSQVTYIARRNSRHRDSSVLCHIDGELLDQPLHLG